MRASRRIVSQVSTRATRFTRRWMGESYRVASKVITKVGSGEREEP